MVHVVKVLVALRKVAGDRAVVVLEHRGEEVLAILGELALLAFTTLRLEARKLDLKLCILVHQVGGIKRVHERGEGRRVHDEEHDGGGNGCAARAERKVTRQADRDAAVDPIGQARADVDAVLLGVMEGPQAPANTPQMMFTAQSAVIADPRQP